MNKIKLIDNSLSIHSLKSPNNINKKITILKTSKFVDIFEYNGKEGWINKKNKKIISYGLDNYYKFEKVGKFKHNEKFGLMDINGNILIDKLDELSTPLQGFFMFEKDERYGYINNKGIIIGQDFDFCFEFNMGKAIFVKNKKYGILDVNGNILIENLDFIGDLKNNFRKFKNNPSCGWIDDKNKILIENFDNCFDFYLDIGTFTKNGKFGCVNKDGIVILKDLKNKPMIHSNKITVRVNNILETYDKNGNKI